VQPSARTSGGFPLFTDADVARLTLVKRMKSLEFSVEDMRNLLVALDALESDDDTPGSRALLLDRLVMFREAADARILALHEHLQTAEDFAKDLRREISRQRRLAAEPSR